jgi:threonylcarbamoyladenosine tRNA methylthiotransferase MtaB
VPQPVRKERAARLRQKGADALARHLAGEIGAHRRVLTESNDLGRTEHFTPVRLAASIEPGMILDLSITGHDGHHLLAA